MKKAFVKTENYARFAAGVKAVEQRGAAEAELGRIEGELKQKLLELRG